jgi:hypothetical protein
MQHAEEKMLDSNEVVAERPGLLLRVADGPSRGWGESLKQTPSIAPIDDTGNQPSQAPSRRQGDISGVTAERSPRSRGADQFAFPRIRWIAFAEFRQPSAGRLQGRQLSLFPSPAGSVPRPAAGRHFGLRQPPDPHKEGTKDERNSSRR